MEPEKFLDTIYLGDRWCKSILLDGQNNRVAVQVNLISRVRDASGNWDFYDKEDIEDGLIVFEDVVSIFFDPPGLIPSDTIGFSNKAVEIVEGNNGSICYRFSLGIGAYDTEGNFAIMAVKVTARSIHLEDPKKPGIKITE
jgi:hypothetical protein